MTTYLTDKVFHENWHPRQLSPDRAKDYYSKLLPVSTNYRPCPRKERMAKATELV